MYVLDIGIWMLSCVIKRIRISERSYPEHTLLLAYVCDFLLQDSFSQKLLIYLLRLREWKNLAYATHWLQINKSQSCLDLSLLGSLLIHFDDCSEMQRGV